MSLSFLIWSTLIASLVAFWWGGDKVKAVAMTHVYKLCKEQNLQLLDQTMVLKGVWPVRDNEGLMRLRRRYTSSSHQPERHDLKAQRSYTACACTSCISIPICCPKTTTNFYISDRWICAAQDKTAGAHSLGPPHK